MRHTIRTCSGVLLIWLAFASPTWAVEQPLAAVSTQPSTGASQNFSPVTALKNYYVDPYTGTANFTIPLVIPPPRQSLPFSLNLVYSSRAGNGWLGVGWKLNLGVVERSTKNGYPTYTATDQFVFSLGEQQNDLVAVGGQEYRPKTADAAWRFLFDGNVWTANDPRGNTYTFGLEQQLGDLSRTKDPKTPGHVFRWRLSKISDPIGNSVIFKYLADRIEISYTEKSESTKGSLRQEDYNYLITIKFTQTRSDQLSNARPGFNDNYPLDGKGRGEEISIRYRDQLARRYVLSYDESQVTGRSLLHKVTEYGRDDQTANPPVVLRYSIDGPSYATHRTQITPIGDHLWAVHVAQAPANMPTGTMLLNPTGFEVTDQGGTKTFPLDWQDVSLRGTGNTESGFSWETRSDGHIVVHGKKGQAFYISTYVRGRESSWLTIPFQDNAHASIRNNCPSCTDHNIGLSADEPVQMIISGYNLNEDFTFTLNLDLANRVQWMSSQLPLLPKLSGDFNGDGITDIGQCDKSAGACTINLSGPAGFEPSQQWIAGFTREGDVLLGDFDGDGKTDLCNVLPTSGNWRVALSTGNQFQDAGVWLTGFGADAPDTKIIRVVGEFNGDGRTDIGFFSYASSRPDLSLYFQAALSTGKGFMLEERQLFKVEGFRNQAWMPAVADFNGDGLSDFLLITPDIWAGLYISIKGYRNTWFSKFSSIGIGGPDARVDHVTLCDVDGDNRLDLCMVISPVGGWGQNRLVESATNLENGGSDAVPLSPVFWEPEVASLQIGDFNGDGLSDFAAYTKLGDVLDLVMSNPGQPADLLVNVENGWGASLDFGYQASSVYRDAGGAPRKTGMPLSVPVLSTITSDDGVGHRFATRYTYSDGSYDVPSKEFRGFGHVTSVDPDGHLTESWFHQDDVLKGKVSRQLVKDRSGLRLAETANQWTAALPFFNTRIVSLGETTATVPDGKGGTQQTKATFQYDAYGNQTQAKSWGDVTTLGDERLTVTEYAPNTRNWLLTYPTHRFTQDATGKTVQEQWWYYDKASSFTIPPTMGLATQEERWLWNPLTSSSSKVQRSYDYDAFGNQTAATDPLRHTTRTDYDSALHIYPAVVTNALQHRVQSTYDPLTGQVDTVTDANQQTTRTVYDALGRIEAVIGPDDTEASPGETRQYRMAAENLIENGSFESWVTSSCGQTDDTTVTCYRRPASWRVELDVAMLRPYIEETYIARDATQARSGQFSLRIEPAPVMQHVSFSDEGFSFGRATALNRKMVTFSAWVKASRAGRVRLAVDQSSDLSTLPKTYSSFNSGSSQWEELSVTHEITDGVYQLDFVVEVPAAQGPGGGEPVYIDDARAIVHEGVATLAPVGPVRVTTRTKTSYDSAHPDELVRHDFYDGWGRLIQRQVPVEPDPVSGLPRYRISNVTRYDAHGRAKETFRPRFETGEAGSYLPPDPATPKEASESDGLGRLLRLTHPDGTFQERRYDGWTTTIQDENGHRITQARDAYGNIVRVEERNGSQTYVTRYEYDALDRVTRVIDHAGNVTQFVYDTLGRRLQVQDPDRGATTSDYDAVGNLVRQTDARQVVSILDRDPLNRLVAKRYSLPATLSGLSTRPVTYVYDDPAQPYRIGRLARISDASGATEFSYDRLGRQTNTVHTVDGVNFTVARTYDAADRLQELRYPDQTAIVYRYGKGGEVASVMSGATAIVERVNYAPTQQVASIEFGNHTTTSYAYEPLTRRLKHILTTAPSGAIQDLDYGFDGVGNVKTIQDPMGGDSRTFLYDDLNRLTDAQGSSGVAHYAYDPSGNLREKEGMTLQYASLRPHAVQSTSAGAAMEYDPGGNLVRTTQGDRAEECVYDEEQRLVRVTGRQASASVPGPVPRPIRPPGRPRLPIQTTPLPVSATTEFVYDAQGTRVKKTVNGVGTVYVENLYERDADGTVRKHVWLGPQRIYTQVVIPSASKGKMSISSLSMTVSSQSAQAESSGSVRVSEETKPSPWGWYGMARWDRGVWRFGDQLLRLLQATTSSPSPSPSPSTASITTSAANRAPVFQSLTMAPITPVANAPIRFQAVATDADGDVLVYAWDFGDGTSSAEVNTNEIQHTYARPGTYTVRVAVLDAADRENRSLVLTVAAPPPGTHATEGMAVTRKSTTSVVPGGYRLIAAPETVTAGSLITVTWTAPQGQAASSDWIGLYEVGASAGNYLTYRYATGASTGQVTLAVPHQPGTYEARYYPNGKYEPLLAVSNPITVILPSTIETQYRLTVSSTQVASGGAVTVSWVTPTAHPSGGIFGDWLGLYEVGASDRDYRAITYIPWGVTNGSTTFTLTNPTTRINKTYEFRYGLADVYTVVATSSPITVAPSVPLVRLTVPSHVLLGQDVSVTWTAQAQAVSTSDWIALYEVGAPDRGYLGYCSNSEGKASGTCVLGRSYVKAGKVYEFRYLRGGLDIVEVGTSNPMLVTVDRDVAAPTVMMTTPTGGATVSGAVRMAVTASDNVGVNRLEFLADGAIVATQDIPPFTASFNMTATWDSSQATNGPHALAVRAFDAAGNVGTTTRRVTVANQHQAVSSGSMFYHADHLGSSTLITDQAGAVVQRMSYMPFGGFAAPPTGSVDVHHYFTGKELDPSTSLYYFGARYYQPTLGRFTQPDPLIQNLYDPQSLNPYTYARNNPLRLVDPDGRAFSSSNSGFGSFGGFGGVGDFASSFSSWAMNATWSFSQSFQGLGSFTATSFNASMTGALLTMQDLGPQFSTWGRESLGYTAPFGAPPFSPALAGTLANLVNAMEFERAGVRLQPFSRSGGIYVSVSGSRGYFPLAPGAYRLDNPGVARYLSAGAAARYAVTGWRLGATAGLVTAYDVSLQLAGGGSLLDPDFLGHTALDVGGALISSAVGAMAGAYLFPMNPAAGLAVSVIVSTGLGQFFDWVKQQVASSSGY